MSLAAPATRRTIAPIALDLAERLAIAALYAWLVIRLANAPEGTSRLVSGLLLVSEGLVIVFLLTRRSTAEVSRNPRDWALAMTATCGPLLVNPGRGQPLISPAWAASVWLVGTLLQISAKMALGRSFGCVPAHRGLKRGGPYRLVRHPMYAGYLLSHIAFLLVNPTPLNFAIYALCDGIQVPRILVEEQLLGRDPAYRAYRDRVRWRVLPGVF